MAWLPAVISDAIGKVSVENIATDAIHRFSFVPIGR